MESPSQSPWPAYLGLLGTGDLQKRAETLAAMYKRCTLCPRDCKVDRTQGKLGGCFSGAAPTVASHGPHHGEEPPISARRGSGTIFFANCNLRCVYCQNHQISQMRHAAAGREVSIPRLAEIMLELQGDGCHNINFVSPTHFTPSIVQAVLLAAEQGLRLPLVYNTNGFDSLEVLRLLDGIVDIYMPDLKYADARTGVRLSKIHNYPRAARAAIAEMFRQVGELKLDGERAARRGVLIRHLVLPGGLAGSLETLRWVHDALSPRASLSVMAQYYPSNKAAEHPPLNRRVALAEYLPVTDLLDELGMNRGWVQSHAEAPDHYRPNFDLEDPFGE
jgi:putative pyruvate formate lyase activating enzyme